MTHRDENREIRTQSTPFEIIKGTLGYFDKTVILVT